MSPAYQGTLSTIRNQVLTVLRLDAADDSDRVDEWVNLAYQDVAQATGALQATADAALTNNVASYAIPAAVAEVNLVVITYSDGSFSAPVQRVDLEQILTWRRTNLAVGEQLYNPKYALNGQNMIELWPTPGSGQTLTFWYSYLPDLLALDGDVPLLQEPFGSRVLLYGAMVEGARFLKDPLLTDFENQYQAWLAKYQVWLNRRKGETGMAFRVRSNYDTGNLVGLARDVG